MGEISNYGQTSHTDVNHIGKSDWILELEDIEKDSGRLIQKISRFERNISGVRSNFTKGTILYSKLRTYLNKVLVAPDNGYCTTEIIPFYCIGNINHFYIAHVLRSQYFIDYTELCCYGCKMPRLSTDDARKGFIPLPPLAEQQRIVAEVEKWFAIIDALEANKEDLKDYIKQVKSKVLSLAISGKLVPQDPNDEPAIELLKRINPNFKPCDTSHYENLPDGWQIVPMHILCSLAEGEKQSGVNRIYLDVKFLRGRSEKKILSEGKYIPSNSTMILVDGENSGEIFTTDIDGYQGSTFKLLNITNEMYKPFILYIVKSYQILFRENKVGSAIPHLNKKLFKEINVLVPPYKEQKRIVKKVDNIFEVIDNISAEL